MQLHTLQVRCPCCHRMAIGGLHLALVAALDAACLLYLLRLG
ncbi:MAG TPA: hypothetical protein VF546_14300 [Pyrinomonadaceae bacterium]|jgi:hypothetical protein